MIEKCMIGIFIACRYNNIVDESQIMSMFKIMWNESNKWTFIACLIKLNIDRLNYWCYMHCSLKLTIISKTTRLLYHTMQIVHALGWTLGIVSSKWYSTRAKPSLQTSIVHVPSCVVFCKDIQLCDLPHSAA